MDDIRDKFPMPPCVQCGRGMCVKSPTNEGYQCSRCGQQYELGATIRPMDNMKAISLRPLVLNMRLTTGHWLMAMEHAMETMNPAAMVIAMNTHKRWLSEVGISMASHVIEVRDGAEPEPEPEPAAETDDSDWLSDAQLRKIR